MSNLYLLAAGLLLNGHSTDATQPLEPLIPTDTLPDLAVLSEKSIALAAMSQPQNLVAPPDSSSGLDFAQVMAHSIDRMAERTMPAAPHQQVARSGETQLSDVDFAHVTARSIDRMVERTTPIQAQQPKELSGRADTAFGSESVRSTQTSRQPKLDFTVTTARSIYRMVEQTLPQQTGEATVPPSGTAIATRPAPNSTPDLLNPASSSKAIPSPYQQATRFGSGSSPTFPEFVRALGPASGVQLFQQRIAALQSGRLFTRLTPDSYRSVWANAQGKPSYEQWKQLLALEARAVSRGRGSNRVSVLLGDSLSQWFPSVRLPGKQFWLNQGISGDTSSGVLRRLWAFSQVRTDTIYLMIGINDLKRGTDPQVVVANQQRIVRQLRRDHPQAQIVIQSLLPANWANISNNEVRWVNQNLQAIARQEQAFYLDLYSLFVDETGRLRPEFTTDGLHLNGQGYEVWQWALNRVDTQIANARGQLAQR